MSAPLVTAEVAQPATATEGPESGSAPTAPQQQIIRVHKSGVEPKLQNLVATVNFGCKVDLKTIALRARNAEYNPKRFAAVIMRIREPKTTALIFQSGKMVVTGARTEDDCRQAARKFCKMIQKLEFPAHFKDFKIQNMVASCDVKFPIRLEGLAFAHAPFSSYEPELFPGLIYRMKSPKIVLLIFVSGKVVLTGGKQRIDLYQAFENIYPVLQQFKKGDVAQPGPQPQQQAQLPPGQALPALPAPPPAAPQQQRQLPPLGGFGAPQQHMQYPGGR